MRSYFSLTSWERHVYNKHAMVSQCWLNSGSPSMSFAKQKNIIGSTYRHAQSKHLVSIGSADIATQ